MLRLELSTLSNDLCNILYFLWLKVLWKQQDAGG